MEVQGCSPQNSDETTVAATLQLLREAACIVNLKSTEHRLWPSKLQIWKSKVVLIGSLLLLLLALTKLTAHRQNMLEIQVSLSDSWCFSEHLSSDRQSGKRDGRGMTKGITHTCLTWEGQMASPIDPASVGTKRSGDTWRRDQRLRAGRRSDTSVSVRKSDTLRLPNVRDDNLPSCAQHETIAINNCQATGK